jgi:hypothetical protein
VTSLRIRKLRIRKSFATLVGLISFRLEVVTLHYHRRYDPSPVIGSIKKLKTFVTFRAEVHIDASSLTCPTQERPSCRRLTKSPA